MVEEGLEDEYQCLLHVAEDADRPSGTRPVRPSCRCHCDHLTGSTGRPGCRAVSRDRVPARGWDVQGATGIAIWFAAAVRLKVVVTDTQLQEWPDRVAERSPHNEQVGANVLGISSPPLIPMEAGHGGARLR